LSGRITTVVMSRSGQLCLRCTVESTVAACPHALQAPRKHTTVLWTHVSLVVCLSLFLCSTTRWGSWGTWQHRSSPLEEARPGSRGSAGVHLSRKVRSRAEEHMAVSELFSRRERAQSYGTRGNAETHLDREARSVAEKHVATLELNSVRRRGPGPRDT
jgi:hypothetical protein